MAQQPQINMNRLSTAGKILLGASALLFVDLFLNWYKCEVNGFSCGKASGWNGALGVLVGILVIAIIAMEVINLLGVQVPMGSPKMRNQVEAGLAGAVALLTILHFLLKPGVEGAGGLGVSIDVSWGIFAFIGLVLGLVVGYGGFMRWQEASVASPPPAAPAGGGFAP
jgi:hypothetical protein